MKQFKTLIYTALLISLFLIYRGDRVSSNSSQKCFKTLFQFGASLFDTGNAVIAFPQQAFQPARPPYGSTFPGHPDNRYCDGKLIIDHLADAFKVPLLSPFLSGFEQLVKKGSGMAVETRDYRNGVCFSVALATALSVPELLLAGVKTLNITINPLTSDVQYQWFQMFRRVTIASAVIPGKLGQELLNPKEFESALYVPGEFGDNDYRAALVSGLSFEKVKGMVPSVVAKIVQLTENLYGVGARNFLVMGVPPQGCSPFYLTMLNGSRDGFNCHIQVNEIYRLHESKLKIAIKDLREKLQDSNIMFADYYGAFMSVMKHPAKYGMKVRNVACCGGGGPYNYNPQAVCGTDSCTRCSNPETHVFWDDFHTSDAFNHIIANKFLSGEFVDPPAINLGCSS